MKRVTDKRYFTYSAYSAKTSGISVKCPNCRGLAVVTTDENNAHFKCTNCGNSKDKSLNIFRYDVHNQCVTCGRYYRVDISNEKKQHFPALYVACPYCGTMMSGTVQKIIKGTYVSTVRPSACFYENGKKQRQNCKNIKRYAKEFSLIFQQKFTKF